MDFDKLSPEQKEALRQQFLNEEKEKEQRKKQERKNYKTLVNDVVPGLFTELENISAQLSAIKTKVFQELETLVKMKAELYDSELDQYSHSFTTDDGITLRIGRRYNDGWDDTVTAGLEKVHKFLESLGKDDVSKKLVKTILQLLSKDKAGNLKSSRVLQLKKLSEEIGDPVFIDAIQIIQDAYRPVKTKEFVTALYKDKNGETHDLPLDISGADFDFKIDRFESQKKAS